jgi:VanZ family protein
MERRKVAVVAVVLAVVVVGSLVSPSSLPTPGFAGWDKLQHAAAYFALALVGFYASDRDRWLAVAVGVAALGAGIEATQAFLSYRTASVADAAANVVGVAAALVVSLLAER